MATTIQMPKLSDTMTEGLILKWVKNEGDKVKQGEILVEIESDKADMELEAYDSGVLRKVFIPAGGKAPIGAPIAIIAEPDEDISALLAQPMEKPKALKSEAPVPSSAPSAPAPAPPPPAPASLPEGRLKASPLARKLAEANRIELRAIKGSGPEGRIIKRDIEPLVSGRSAFVPPAAGIVPSGETKDVPLSPIRKTIAKRMTESKTTVPHFYVTVEIDMANAISFRDQLNSASQTKISFTDILVKAAALTLMRHPNVNATYLGESMRQYGDAHVAVAVAMDDGLVTPVLRNCERKGIYQLNTELRDLVERARNRRLKPEEYSGATFTISNLGMFGVEDFVAIVNPPEGSILAVGAIIEKPVVKEGQIVIGNTMKVTLSSDHRIIDGAVAARFLQDLKRLMENPVLMLL